MPCCSNSLAAQIPSQVDASLIKIRDLSIPASWYKLISLWAFSIEPALSNDKRASTSVEMRPGTILGSLNRY